ncbi:hypothetical protein STAN_7055 [Streptomyces sp. CBMAI 2042]|uniref:hypothetical protein n=1 Tax=Streptomyces sp. CBMAI 2042 TaxID=2305222 RepID=UPI000F27BB02|nr:hypothetical protein [Streptomyces sp. CBMAI 2042]RLV64235.1 hypothetical protein STAN_7055 [Streptomyces sp. CBMAI 2042]
MFPIRRTWQAQAAFTSPSWSYAHTDPEQLHQVLAEQTAAANREASDHPTEAATWNVDELHVQPGVLEVRRDVLTDVHYLEGLLIGARHRGLDPELIERLAAAVDTGHELTVLLADVARATITAPAAGR